MTKGKYGQRADTRLRVLESEALQQAHTKIKTLETQVADAKHVLNVAKSDVQSQALRIAGGLSSKEKQHLRNQIASLEYQASEERIRNAVLTWELMHRVKFNAPSPTKILRDETPESHKYWIEVHWEIGALFMSDYDEFWRFFNIAQGYEWVMVGDRVNSLREINRNLHKGKIKDNLVKRVRNLRAYYDRIWKARQAGAVEPISYEFKNDHTNFAAQDIRDNLVKKMKSRDQG